MNQVHRWLCSSALWRGALERRLLPWVLDGVDLGDAPLEIGPGPGLTVDLLRARVAHMTALEIDSRLAASLRQRLSGASVRVVEGDGAAMPFADNTFSAVLSLTMLHHVASPALQDRLFAEAYRVLRPQGVFVGTDNTWNLAFHLLHLGDTMVVVDPDTLKARLEDVGFASVTVHPVRGRFRFQAQKPGLAGM